MMSQTFNSAQVSRACRISLRQLQYWTEAGVVPVKVVQHSRVFAFEDAVLCGVVARLRDCRVALWECRKVVDKVRLILRKPEVPCYLVISKSSTGLRVCGCFTDSEVIRESSQSKCLGVVLVDLLKICGWIEREGLCHAKKYAPKKEAAASFEQKKAVGW